MTKHPPGTLASGPRPGIPAPVVSALAAGLGNAVFLAFWWNRHLGLSLDGYMPWYGHRILMGEVPYRDFFLHLPPLQPLFEAAIEAFAGRSILAGRLFGALVSALTAAAIAAWLARFYRPWTAVAAALAAVAVGAADDTEILDLYNHHAALAAVASGLAAAIALDARGERRRTAAWLASGALAAASIWLKQTIGLGATLSVPLVLLILAFWRPENSARRALSGLARFAAGWSLVSSLLLAWLASQGAAGAFARQVFVDAAGSKGSVWILLVRPFVAPFQLASTREPAWIAAGVAVAALAAFRLARSSGSVTRVSRARAFLLSAAALATMTIVVQATARLRSVLASGSERAIAEVWHVGYASLVLAAFYFVVVAAVVEASRAVTRRAHFDAQRLLLVVVGSSVAGTLALSYPMSGNMGVPALAILIAHLAEAPPRRRALRFARPVAAAVTAVALVAALGIRIERPFEFAGWREPPMWKSNQRSSLSELAGLRLSAGTIGTVDTITHLLRETTGPGEPIFTFSVYPIFHWLADRPTATFASLHWIDVTPDPVTREDLETLRAAPPAAVVRQWIPEDLLALNEAYFREGRRSALREMQEGLNRLLEERYVLLFQAPRSPPHGPPLQLWIRADRASNRPGLRSLPTSDAPPGGPGTAP